MREDLPWGFKTQHRQILQKGGDKKARARARNYDLTIPDSSRWTRPVEIKFNCDTMTNTDKHNVRKQLSVWWSASTRSSPDGCEMSSSALRTRRFVHKKGN